MVRDPLNAQLTTMYMGKVLRGLKSAHHHVYGEGVMGLEVL